MGDTNKLWHGVGRALVLGSALAASGCSFVLVPIPPSAPAERTEQAAAKCTTSNTVPAVDAVLTGVGLFYTVSGAVADDPDHAFLSPMGPTGTTALGVTAAALYGVSAAFGFLSTSRCAELREEVRQKPPKSDDKETRTNSPPAPSATAPVEPSQAVPADPNPAVPADPNPPAPTAPPSAPAATAPGGSQPKPPDGPTGSFPVE